MTRRRILMQRASGLWLPLLLPSLFAAAYQQRSAAPLSVALLLLLLTTRSNSWILLGSAPLSLFLSACFYPLCFSSSHAIYPRPVAAPLRSAATPTAQAHCWRSAFVLLVVVEFGGGVVVLLRSVVVVDDQSAAAETTHTHREVDRQTEIDTRTGAG